MTNQSVTIRGPIVGTSTPDGISTAGTIQGGSITSTGDITTNNGSITARNAAFSGFVTASSIASQTTAGYGLYATSDSGAGVLGRGNPGVVAYGSPFAGQFIGDVFVTGTLTKFGGGFRIDHPLDSPNKYLSHSFVESPDMKNVYDGVAMLDADGVAVVELPAWFEALNTDFRYQLTPIGAPGPNLYIAEEISNNHFRIAGGMPSMKVCWLVTGIRQDAWANAHRMRVEEDKPTEEQGHYLHPELYGESEEKHVRLMRYPETV